LKNIYLSPSDVIGSGRIKVDEVKKTVCPRNCFDTCGLLAYVKDGKLLKIEGDPDHPITIQRAIFAPKALCMLGALTIKTESNTRSCASANAAKAILSG